MAAVYGISIDQVRQELFNAFGNRQVATIYTPSNDYQVILENKPEFQVDTTELSHIYLKTTRSAPRRDRPRGGGVNGVGVPSGTQFRSARSPSSYPPSAPCRSTTRVSSRR